MVSRPRIMVVEDEVVSAESLKMTLKEFGYDTVALVTSGEVAVLKAAELGPDLVIMDISLAGRMDGAQAAFRIHSDHGTPIIFLTAYADDHHLEKARLAEPYAFLIKPFNNRELKAAIETALYKASMEERLRRSEERLDITLRSIGDAVITTDPQGRVEYFNEMARQLTGWSSDEAKGRPAGEIFRVEGEDPAGRPQDPVAMALSRGRTAGPDSEAVLLDRNGRKIPIDHSAAPILDRQGLAAGVVLVFRDVTERKNAQEALAQSEAALRSLFRAAPIGIGLVKDRRLGWTNERFNTIIGYSQEELEGQSSRILYPDDEEYERVGNIQIPQVRRFGRGAIETRMRCKDGRLLDVLLSSASLHPTDYSAGFVFTILDVTERKRAEEALRESEERYRALVETIPHGVQEIDAEGRIVYSNQVLSDLLGYRPDELAGRLLYDLCDGEEPRCTLKKKIENIVLEQPRLHPFETRLLARDGQAIEAKIDWNYKRDPQGGLGGLISIVTDVTRQKELEAQLQRARKMQAIGTLAGGIAHDFNNILAAIMGYTELTLLELPETLPIRKNLERVLESGQRAKRLIQQILDFSRPTDKGRMPIDTCVVISEALNLLAPTLPSQIELVRDFHPDAGFTMADPTQLHQLVMNLCTNAAQVMKENGGKIEVAVEQVYLDEEASKSFVGLAPGPYQKITVRDNGPGMTREIQERIFEPFFTTRKTGQGVGLGLSVVHGIVKGHGGAITIQSQPGAGAVFSVLLPMTERSAAEATPAYVERSLPTGTESILFVDDEEALVDLAGHALERLGYRFTGAYSGEEALEHFRKSPTAFDLVITDQNMPGLKGADVAREMLALRPDLPIVMYTGYADSITADMAIKMGFRHFLSKPILAREIAYAIRRILDGR